MTQPTPIPEAMIEAAALALHKLDNYLLDDPPWEHLTEDERDSYRRAAKATLAAALATCEATTHTEWASEHVGDLGLVPSPFLQKTGRDRALAEIRVTDWRENRPDVATRLLRAEVTVYRLPWVPVEDGGESA